MEFGKNKPDGFFGNRLAWFMNQEDIDVSQVAKSLNCSAEHVRKMISGRVLPSKGLVKRIAVVMREKESKLLGLVEADHGRKKLKNFYPLFGMKKEYERFYFIWDYLKPEEKEVLIVATEIFAKHAQAKCDRDAEQINE